ncbi:protein ACCELERATED CELL DEATH 6-like [Phragmites australis]|uniref:protein ACCELERATED CELL DEATH 6-like n=1 Tax=Phragmites australis TaxID=29695 RepID=UPI002D77636A|nr:protein ACCELERATED CELL DEATH 6-like [Phragmites australis]
MASTTNDEPPSSSTVANTPAGAMDAKLTAATGCGECRRTKDLLNEEDTATRVVVIASNMHPLLLAAACKGNWEELNFLLNREDAQGQPTVMPSQEFLDRLATYTSGQRATADVEEGAMVSVPLPSAASLLEGVTMEGDTALHVVAALGDVLKFLKCADLVYGKDKTFLSKPNYKGDTPLHCAARAGKSQMVSHLIDLAGREQGGHKTVEDLLRKENASKETALHEAVRIGNNRLVELLLSDDSKLATFPKEGISPLYLAILLEKDAIAQILHDQSEDNILSYSGPSGQNALHAAVLRNTEMIRNLLEWNKGLTTQADINGSTPLHFISSQSPRRNAVWVEMPDLTEKLLGWNKDLAKDRDENGSTPLHFAALHSAALHFANALPGQWWQRRLVCLQVLEANPDALYQSDSNGLFPIHVAASVGASSNVAMFVKRCPSIAALRDAKGRTFLHVAVEKKKKAVVSYACRNRSLEWILNIKDNDGNTALHLAVQAGSLGMFCALFGNRQVDLNLTNAKGQTPLDIAEYKIPPGLFYNLNSESRIRIALSMAGAKNGVSRQDHFIEKYEDIHRVKSDYDIKELDYLKDSTQTLSIGSVLIATMTFGATFALPGGYIQDDHPNGGTPTLAGSYAFDAFMLANTLAFICSLLATVGLMFSGIPMVHLTQIYGVRYTRRSRKPILGSWRARPGSIMSQVRVRAGFSDAGVYDHFESTAVIFASPPGGSEITFGTMAYRWDDQGELIHTGIVESSPRRGVRDAFLQATKETGPIRVDRRGGEDFSGLKNVFIVSVDSNPA